MHFYEQEKKEEKKYMIIYKIIIKFHFIKCLLFYFMRIIYLNVLVVE
jgi:hypothetical protein